MHHDLSYNSLIVSGYTTLWKKVEFLAVLWVSALKIGRRLKENLLLGFWLRLFGAMLDFAFGLPLIFVFWLPFR